MSSVGCDHKFVIVREIDDRKLHKSGVIVVCAEGCGVRRQVWDDGVVIFMPRE